MSHLRRLVHQCFNRVEILGLYLILIIKWSESVGTSLTYDVSDLWSMSSANHDMIYLSSCKSIWGYPCLKMNICMWEHVTTDKVSGGHKITCHLVFCIAAITMLYLFNSRVKFLSAPALKRLLTFHVARFQSFFHFCELLRFPGHGRRLNWLVTLWASQQEMFLQRWQCQPHASTPNLEDQGLFC
jgi:hypothetical protein